ncbi:hypothetical protein J1N10_15900 [Carboxylicivirga sp. A043]|uniref:hypothetical protein n=1 Tax=Carboxylicivirga litoralis TaxID=2816963 RepID=UPI0021CB52A3|nr:hypothetical protein [Carboxylicivirga sp. A043]MCU4157461.1 hypothetical protein [Carboxylicivirga sp. A043]
MRTKHILIIFLLGLTINIFGQNAHYFKPWKSKAKFEKMEIVFLIDTTGTSDDTKVLLIVASKIDDNLKVKGIKTKPIPFPNDTSIDVNTLCLKLAKLDKAYVKLNTFESKIPLCFRLNMTQIQPDSKKMIETDISFSIDRKQQGVDELGTEVANRLLRHFNLEE